MKRRIIEGMAALELPAMGVEANAIENPTYTQHVA